MIKLKLVLEVVFFNIAMYLVCAIGNLAVFATFLFASDGRGWAYDWVTWIAGSTIWATALLHYFLHRSDSSLSRIDPKVLEHSQSIVKKFNNSLTVGLMNAMLLIPLALLSGLSLYYGFGGGTLRVCIQLGGALSFLFAVLAFTNSKKTAEDGWVRTK